MMLTTDFVTAPFLQCLLYVELLVFLCKNGIMNYNNIDIAY